MLGWLVLLVTVFLANHVYSFKIVSYISSISHPSQQLQFRKRSLRMSFDPLVSLGASSVAGVIGIGAAYPFDSLKVKMQTYASSGLIDASNLSMSKTAKLVYNQEGIQGFYSGVFGVMVGEAFVKASLFGSNYWALSYLTPSDSTDPPSILVLCLAAAFSGVVSSFVLNPIERIKILMQADKTNRYKSELDCAAQVIQSDGVFGLLTRGLDGMIIRELPGCTVYFLVYTFLKNSILTSLVGDAAAAFVSGAAAGVGAWIPIYPSDVVKTNMQNTQGESSESLGFLETAISLQQKFGWGIFYEGVQPKLLRAAVNHSFTFYIYNLIINFFD